MTQAHIEHPPSPTQQSERWSQLPGCSLGLALSNLAAEYKAPLVLITSDQSVSRSLQTTIESAAPDLPIYRLPDWETLPYDHLYSYYGDGY